MQNLRQKGMTIKEYIEEFYHVNLWVGYIDDAPEKIARYVNSLRLEILDEISILSPRNIEEALQSAVKAEEKINRKHNNRRGREIVEDEDSPTVEGELPLTVKKAAAQNLQGQQTKETTPEEVGHISEDEGMAVEEGLVSSATGVKNGGIDPLNVQKLSRQVIGEHI